MGDHKCGKYKFFKLDGLVSYERVCRKRFHYCCVDMSSDKFTMCSKSKKCDIVECTFFKEHENNLFGIDKSLAYLKVDIEATIKDKLNKISNFKQDLLKHTQKEFDEKLFPRLDASNSCSSNPEIPLNNL